MNDSWHSSPEQVRFVNEDVPRFWEAYDQVIANTVPAEQEVALQQVYLDPGTPGLHSFVNAFALSASSLVDSTIAARAYFDHVRSATLGFPDASEEVALRNVLADWELLYPKARYPDVYWVVGNTLTAGTVTSSGIVIGTETVARTSGDLDSSTPSYLVEADISRDTLTYILAHEIAHAQQKYYSGPQTVLFSVILEGGAEFLCELVTGRIVNEQLRQYGDAHAAELWTELVSVKGRLGREWFAASGDRPANIGYYIGYQITKSYYEKHPDPAQAIDDILNIDDFEKFLEASGYESQFE